MTGVVVVRIGVVGSEGTTGRHVVGALADAGHAIEHLATSASTEESVRGLDAVISAVAPAAGRRIRVAAAATDVPHVDACLEQEHLLEVDRAPGGGPRMAGAGLAFLVGDLLASRACAHLETPVELHVAYALPRTSDLVLGLSPGTRRSVVAGLASETVWLRDGERRELLAGEGRRLAWFPRPVGPRHAASIPGGEMISVPRHVDGLATVGTYVAVPSLVAELLQAGARWARRPDAADALAGRLARLGTPDEHRRAATRWACVAEARGPGGVSRAWAYGTDPYRFTGHALVAVAERLAGGGVRSGASSPAQLGDAGALLDDLAGRTGMRWSVAPPTPDPRGGPPNR